MSASDRHLVLLDDHFPTISRMSRWRIEQEPDFPTPVIVRKRKYYYDDELAAWAESRRRIKRERAAASAAESTQ